VQNRSKKTLLLRASSQQMEQPQGTHDPSKWHHLLQTTLGKRKEHKDGPFHGLIRWSLTNLIHFLLAQQYERVSGVGQKSHTSQGSPSPHRSAANYTCMWYLFGNSYQNGGVTTSTTSSQQDDIGHSKKPYWPHGKSISATTISATKYMASLCGVVV